MADLVPDSYLARVGGVTRQVRSTFKSQGVEDAGKILAANKDGKLDETLLPEGVGPSVDLLVASENLAAGKFVNIHIDGGIAKVRLADATNGRQADGFVDKSYETGEEASVYKIDTNNNRLSGLTVGTEHYLAAAGGVTDTPYDETDPDNQGYISQALGVAKSSTELITEDRGFVIL